MNIIKDITDFIFLEHPPEKSDIIFIPGGSYPELAEAAAELYKAGYAKKILPSGKCGFSKEKFDGPSSKSEVYKDSYESEWDFLKAVLLKNGVLENDILKEDQAQYTYDNALKSKEVLGAANFKVNRAILCCKSFHARRAAMYYQIAFKECELLVHPVDINGLTKDNWHLSPQGKKIVMNELSKCGSQIKDII
jgi:uncharacterized SAM-binding protein YcdF (DUF218 family)